jgi:adenylylsulfate reductase, subunit B
VRVRREEDKATISWKIKFRDGREKNFVSPIRTTPWGSIKSPADYEAPSAEAMKSPQLAHEPEALKVTALPALSRDRFKQGLGWCALIFFFMTRSGGIADIGQTFRNVCYDPQ